MSGEKKVGKKGKFSVKDIIVILVSAIALCGLIFMIKRANEKEKADEQQLQQLSQSMKEDVVLTDFDSLILNEVNREGFIEILNASDKQIDLTGCSVFYQGEPIYVFQEKELLDAGQMIVVELGHILGKDETNILGLYDESGASIVHLMFPKLSKAQSYGCRTDGSYEMNYQSASKGASNSSEDEQRTSKLDFSVQGGFYENGFSLEIYAPEELTVYYTTDGTRPDKYAPVYQDPIQIKNRSGSNHQYADMSDSTYIPSSINMGTVVWAVATDSFGNIVDEKVETYYVSLGSSSEYYGMPVLSIVTEPKYLFDYFEGIYVGGRSYEDALVSGEELGGNYRKDWKRPAFIEFYEADKTKTFDGIVELSILQDLSITSAQKSFRITGNYALAGSSLAGYFHEESREMFLMTNHEDNPYKLRNILAKQLLGDTGIGMGDMEPCIVFLNGEYWGCYMLSAPYDQSYFSKHYQVSQPVITVSNNKISDYSYNSEYQAFYRYVIEHDMSDADAYEYVKERMDVDSYLDFLCVNMYLANGDYSPRNAVMWKTVGEKSEGYEDGRWRWIIPELEYCMANEMTGKCSSFSIDSFLSPAVTGDAFLQSLLMNDEFKNDLSNTMRYLAETVFAGDTVENALQECKELMRKQAIATYKRFMGDCREDFYDTEVEKISEFFANRAEYILLYTDEVITAGGNLDFIKAVRDNSEEAIGVLEQQEEINGESPEDNG